MANAFTYNSIDFSSYGLIVTAANKTLVSPPRFERIKTPYEDGEIFSDSYFDPRTISLDCVVRSATNSGLKTFLNNIEKALTEREDKKLILDSDTDKYYNARLASGINYKQIGVGTAFFSMEFISSSPFSYSTSTDSEDESITTNPQSFTLTTGGDSTTYPTFLLTADSSLSSVIFEHIDREESLTWGGSMVSGDVLKVECDPKAWKISLAPASDPTDFIRSTETISGFFPVLDSGVNAMRIHNSSGDLNTKHIARYKS